MLDLTFGEQVKIILRRKGMTIKELAEIMEEHTGKKMSRQNLTQRLGRDNFQEQDMRQIAAILGCRFQLSIMEESVSADKNFKEEQNNEIDSVNDFKADMTVGEVIDNFGVEENIAVEQVYEGETPDEVVEEVYEEPVYEASVEEVAEEIYEEPAYEAQVEEVAEEVYEEPAYEAQVEEVEEEVYEEPVYTEEYVEEAYEEPVYEAPVAEEAYIQEEVYEEPVYEEQASVEEALKELESLEQEDKAYKLEKEQKAKKKGWRDRFGFSRKKEEEQPVKAEPAKAAVQEPVYEEPVQAEPVQEEVVMEDAAPAEGYTEPVYEEPVYEEGAVQESYEEPAYEEAVQESYEGQVYEDAYEEPVGDVNPYTGREYETNSVRMHPKKIGYVQVYDRDEHKWIDMTEWAFLGYQEQKKMLLGKDYDPPIYLD